MSRLSLMPVCVLGAIAAASVGLGTTMTAHAANAVYLPCPDYQVGNLWRYTEQDRSASSETVTTVLGVDGATITIGETKTSRLAPHPNVRVTMPDARQKTTSTLVRQGETIFRSTLAIEIAQRDRGEMRVSISPAPGAPECGMLPATSTYELATTGLGQTIKQQVRAVWEALGKKRIKVAAGEFDTTVVRLRTSSVAVTTPGEPPQPGPAQVLTYYAVEGLGTVKTESTSEMMEPVNTGPPHAADPQVEAALKEGMAALNKGEDPSAAFARMEALSESAASNDPSPVEMQRRTVTRVTELVSYVAN